MKLNPTKWRFCRAVACENLKGMECDTYAECIHPDVKKALDERRAQLKAVKDGRGS